MIVLQADADAPVGWRQVTVQGSCTVDGTTVTRTAHTTAIQSGVNNADGETTSARLTHDLVVAVVDAPVPAASIKPSRTTVETSVGGQLQLPIQVFRRNGFDGEIELAGIDLPKGIKVFRREDQGRRSGDQIAGRG